MNKFSIATCIVTEAVHNSLQCIPGKNATIVLKFSRLFLCLPTCISLCLRICLFVYMYRPLSICLSVFLSLSFSISLSSWYKAAANTNILVVVIFTWLLRKHKCLLVSNQAADGFKSSPRDLVMRILKNTFQRALAHRLGVDPGSPDNETTALPTELSCI